MPGKRRMGDVRGATVGILLLWAAVVTPPAVADVGASPDSSGHLSPYLEMHAKDPVRWRSWSKDVLAQAQQQQRLIFISAGYFSCYWCHVMQRESFQDPEVARVLNDGYIPVVVDRELDPALDKQLLEFVEKYRGVGGWPLNVILTPEGYPLIGGVYFPRQQFHAVLVQMQSRWQEDPEALRKLAREAAQPPRTLTSMQPAPLNAQGVAQLQQLLVRSALQFADDMSGGFGEQNKFPMVPQLDALLSHIAQQPDQQLGDFLRLTLDQMANRGLRDHLAGGFFRYATEPTWSAPHFEKMLYDNALLAGLYLRAGTVFKRADYTAIGRDTLDFILRHMAAKGGGFYGAFSAVNDKGEEGGYYLWSEQELTGLLGADTALVRAAWRMQAPVVEHGFLPFASRPVADLAREFKISPQEVQSRLAAARVALLRERGKRSLPVDDKVLASWNALLLLALTQAVVSGEVSYRDDARALRDFIVARYVSNNAVSRLRTDDGVTVPGALEDYAYVASALLAYSGIAEHAAPDRNLAMRVIHMAWERFHMDSGWRLTDAVLLPSALGRAMVADDVLPSASGLLLAASLKVAVADRDAKLQKLAQSALVADRKTLWVDPFTYAGYVDLLRIWQGELAVSP